MLFRSHYRLKTDPEYAAKFRDKVSKGLQSYFDNGGIPAFKGKSRSYETRAKMRKSQKGKQSGSNNSQYGKVWVYNKELKCSKKVNKCDIPDLIANGWLNGRKMKF